MDLESELRVVISQGQAAFAAATDAAAIEAVRVEYLGRHGRLKTCSAAFAQESPERKRVLGPLLSEANETLRNALTQAQKRLGESQDGPSLDVTEPRPRRRRGSLHPITQVATEVERIFLGMGFSVVDGPHVEEERFNFNLLNIPDDHPARDAHDTFYLTHGRILRTHTSAVQARRYPQLRPPLREVVIGKVFRYDEVDATHDTTFTQVEGFLVDEGITVGHLLGTITTTVKALLARDDVEIRVRPSFFPFVEPGFEVDVRCTTATGRLSSWMELLGCGMIHPKVLSDGGINPHRWSGFAFGIGLERITMIRHGIQDIRIFHGADLRALRQFGAA